VRDALLWTLAALLLIGGGVVLVKLATKEWR
jgi:hypothetical protein